MVGEGEGGRSGGWLPLILWWNWLRCFCPVCGGGSCSGLLLLVCGWPCPLVVVVVGFPCSFDVGVCSHRLLDFWEGPVGSAGRCVASGCLLHFGEGQAGICGGHVDFGENPADFGEGPAGFFESQRTSVRVKHPQTDVRQQKNDLWAHTGGNTAALMQLSENFGK